MARDAYHAVYENGIISLDNSLTPEALADHLRGMDTRMAEAGFRCVKTGKRLSLLEADALIPNGHLFLDASCSFSLPTEAHAQAMIKRFTNPEELTSFALPDGRRIICRKEDYEAIYGVETASAESAPESSRDKLRFERQLTVQRDPLRYS